MIVTAFLCALFAPPPAVDAQTHYTFTKIADSNQIQNLGGINCVGISNSGTVIIVANAELWRGDGQSNPSQVVLTSPLDGGSGCASINDQDEIAYVINTFPSFPYTRLVRNSNGTTTELATSGQSPYLYSTYNPSLTTNGSAVFHGGPSAACGASGGSNHGVYIGPGGAIVYDPICDQAADIREGSVLAGKMNDNLVVAFYAQNKDGTRQGIYRGSLTPLVQDGVNGIALINSPQRPVINNPGIVAFLGTLNGGPASIYTTSDGVSFTRAGQYPNNNGLFAINDSGKVVYTITGSIYTGADLAADNVIATGSQLDGSVFLGGFTYLQSINNSGQVAFFAQLGDCAACQPNRYAVYRADPNHPPVAFDGTASVTAGASVSDTLSATDLDGDSLTYSIVNNADGTKGTAVITNAATGAYTYTANVGSSGTDTFGFKANDSFADSNVATITVTITTPPGACATDISATASVASQGPLKLNRKSGRYTQTVTLKNGDGAASGPVSLVLDNLSGNATLFGVAGTTSCTSPTGSPYVNVDVGAEGLFSPRERATITLEFVNPTGQPVTYTTRVLAGAGSR